MYSENGSQPPFASALARMSARPRQGFVGVNFGANKDSTNRKAD